MPFSYRTRRSYSSVVRVSSFDVSRYRRYGPGRRHGLTYFFGGSRRLPDQGHSIPAPEPEHETCRIPEQASESDKKKVITVVGVNPKCMENARSHHTDKYDQIENGDLVVRRGQPFDIVITFNRPFDEKKDDLRLAFETGLEPMPSKGSEARFLMSAEDKPGQWGAKISGQKGNDLNVTIFTPPNCIVGNWEFSVESVLTEGGDYKTIAYEHPEPFYILFNPWCKEDLVYFSDEKKLSEYVLNDTGAIFKGNGNQISFAPWLFGQFEEDVLEAALFCVYKAFDNRVVSMGDPVKVSRAISRIVNANDDDGVLLGNWSGDYKGGKSPMSWTGSVAILRQYMQTKESVKWGQCFVFSGIVTTICRALGLPCRSTTNFSSAHDGDGSVTIDVHWNFADGKRKCLEHLNHDSVWNFHVWNDVWMKRVDLPVGYGGWQVIDATPQENSGGYSQCGPAPLKAVLNGQCDLQYDTPFIFAEVNADRVHWVQTKTGEFKVIGMEKSAIGKNISTKIPDGRPVSGMFMTNAGRILHNITNEYKFDEESDKERISVINASRTITRGKAVYNTGPKDVKFKFIQRDFIYIGADFENKLVLENTSSAERHVEGTLILDAVNYTGLKAKEIKREDFSVVLKPGDKGEAIMKVTSDEYLDRLTETAAMKVSVLSEVAETEQIQTWQDDFRLRKPDLQVEVVTKCPKAREEMECKISLKNPLKKKTLTSCVLTLEGPGFPTQKEFPQSDIEPGQEFSTTLTLTPKKQGTKQIIASFECDQLNDVVGIEQVEVM